jgi:hypothetical protein
MYVWINRLQRRFRVPIADWTPLGLGRSCPSSFAQFSLGSGKLGSCLLPTTNYYLLSENHEFTLTVTLLLAALLSELDPTGFTLNQNQFNINAAPFSVQFRSTPAPALTDPVYILIFIPHHRRVPLHILIPTARSNPPLIIMPISSRLVS